MAAVRIAELERVTSLARTICAPLADVWSSTRHVTVRIESPEAERADAAGIGEGLEGEFWLLPVELTGVHNGIACILIPHGLDEASGSGTDGFVSLVDDFLASASDRLTASLGGPVSIDRLGLRDIPARRVAEALGEALGGGDLVAVRFAADVPSVDGHPARVGGIIVVFGGRLLKELTTAVFDAGETVENVSRMPTPAAPAPADEPTGAVADILERARGLRLTLSAEIGRREVRLGELIHLGVGSTIEVGKRVTEPVEVWICGRRIAHADAVVLGGRLGVRLRGRS